ncbi:MAG TPA: acetylglutamate kinase [Dehalococcoidales bacterium]|nr:acetylglutamate kinase [Dehalococcoidales bacterium]
MKHKQTIVVKIGGVALGSNDTTVEDIVHLQQQGEQLVVVHGGGKLITEWLKMHGIATRFLGGQRVTDRDSLAVATAVLAGLVNKEIVAAINQLGGRAVGISGADGSLAQCRIEDEKLGYVGKVVRVNTELLDTLLRAGHVPVISPLGIYAFDRPDGAPSLLNINGDIFASEIAAAIGAEKLIFLTDVPGICDRSGDLLSRLSGGEAEELVASGIASGGMIPKIRGCIRVVEIASATCIIDGRQPHALRQQIEGRGGGTTIYKD